MANLTILDLPDDILYLFGEELDTTSQVRFLRTSRRLYHILKRLLQSAISVRRLDLAWPAVKRLSEAEEDEALRLCNLEIGRWDILGGNTLQGQTGAKIEELYDQFVIPMVIDVENRVLEEKKTGGEGYMSYEQHLKEYYHGGKTKILLEKFGYPRHENLKFDEQLPLLAGILWNRRLRRLFSRCRNLKTVRIANIVLEPETVRTLSTLPLVDLSVREYTGKDARLFLEQHEGCGISEINKPLQLGVTNLKSLHLLNLAGMLATENSENLVELLMNCPGLTSLALDTDRMSSLWPSAPLPVLRQRSWYEEYAMRGGPRLQIKVLFLRRWMMIKNNPLSRASAATTFEYSALESLAFEDPNAWSYYTRQSGEMTAWPWPDILPNLRKLKVWGLPESIRQVLEQGLITDLTILPAGYPVSGAEDWSMDDLFVSLGRANTIVNLHIDYRCDERTASEGDSLCAAVVYAESLELLQACTRLRSLSIRLSKWEITDLDQFLSFQKLEMLQIYSLHHMVGKPPHSETERYWVPLHYLPKLHVFEEFFADDSRESLRMLSYLGDLVALGELQELRYFGLENDFLAFGNRKYRHRGTEDAVLEGIEVRRYRNYDLSLDDLMMWEATNGKKKHHIEYEDDFLVALKDYPVRLGLCIQENYVPYEEYEDF